jgi:hypothetical protein
MQAFSRFARVLRAACGTPADFVPSVVEHGVQMEEFCPD